MTKCLACGEFAWDMSISQDMCDDCIDAMEEDG